MEDNVFRTPIAEQIWDQKYRLKLFDGTPVDETVQDTWRRIAKALAEAEDNPDEWEEEFYKALESFKFIPAGRINAGRILRQSEDRENWWCLVLQRSCKCNG